MERDNDRSLLQRMLSKMRFSIRDDDWSLIHNNAVIEIYNLDGVQIYRNLRFFQLTSYTLDVLLEHPIYELYERKPDTTPQIKEIFAQFKSAKNPTSIRSSIPRYLMIEASSVQRRRIWVKHRAFIPVLDSKTGKTVAVMLVSSFHLDNTPSTMDKHEEDLFERIFVKLGYPLSQKQTGG